MHDGMPYPLTEADRHLAAGNVHDLNPDSCFSVAVATTVIVSKDKNSFDLPHLATATYWAVALNY